MPKKYILLDKNDKEFIVELIMDNYKISRSFAKILTDNFANSIKNGNYAEVYHLHRYKVYMYHTKDFSSLLLMIILKIYFYLSKKYTQDKEEINMLFFNLINNMYTQNMNDLKKLEKRSETVQGTLIHLTDTLKDTLKTQQLMLANISHEMRTSLNAILGYSSYVLEEKISKVDQKQYLTKIHKASLSLQALISDILDVTKINSDQMEIKNSPFWLDETIMHSIDNISLLANKKDINLITHIDCFTLKLFGDSQRLMQILTNLLSNAIKFTSPQGTIELRAKILSQSNTNTSVYIEVQDNGIGMNEEELQNILHPYVRFQPKAQGVGLGLHITHKLIQKMGGKLYIESTKGMGSKFSINFTLKHILNNKISLKDKCIYFFNDTTDYERKNILTHKMDVLKSLGANIQLYTREADFTEELIHMETNIPNIISITSQDNHYGKFDALINYIKTKPHFYDTFFIAEQTFKYTNLTAFDQVFERFANISTYFTAVETLKKTHIKSENNDKHLSILAVDDIETNLEILQLLIEKKYPKIAIDLASGGYEAIGMYKAKSYDLIFLDLKMPGLDGFNVLKKIMKIKIPPPIYALTADIYKDTYEKVKSVGFTGLHEKPLKPNLIFDTIEGIINAKNTKSN